MLLLSKKESSYENNHTEDIEATSHCIVDYTLGEGIKGCGGITNPKLLIIIRIISVEDYDIIHSLASGNDGISVKIYSVKLKKCHRC